ncbi:MAG TPA: flippase-like domain-containing protein [Anaerolineae bacterium]|nr:flippase-like domain-containing protein [Anaerolineae bacterium]HIP71255.1 flippase-like domain-containing protein [Anaerolineae bacterium]
MTAEESETPPPARFNYKKLWPWVNAGIAFLLIAGGVWFLNRTVGLDKIGEAMRLADGRFILLALPVVTLIGAVKAWRWGLLLTPNGENIPYSSLFWSTWLGQVVNIAIPFLRLGEVARAYTIDQQTDIGKVRALSTMVVEKTLELIMLALLLAVIVPLVVLPEVFNNWWMLGILAGFILLGLYLVAYQTDFIIRMTKQMGRWLPVRLQNKIMPLVLSGLAGIASLRDKKTVLLLLGSSLFITFLSILTPFILFRAMAIPLGLPEAAVVDSALNIVTTPPSTPGQLGVFEGTTVFILNQFGQENNARLVSYAIIYHLVALAPIIVLGSLAAARTRWEWQRDDR